MVAYGSGNFKKELVHKMYKKNLNQILNLNNLDLEYSDTEDLFVLKTSPTTENIFSIAVGGACIDRCDALVRKLGINFYFDILNPIEYAIKNDTKVAIYVDTPIEVYGQEKNVRKRWINFADKIDLFCTI